MLLNYSQNLVTRNRALIVKQLVKYANSHILIV